MSCFDQAPELATAVRTRLEATKHHVLATLRKNGSPRVSGTEVDFFGPDLMTEVVLTSLHPDGDRLVIETWRPGQPVARVERR